MDRNHFKKNVPNDSRETRMGKLDLAGSTWVCSESPKRNEGSRQQRARDFGGIAPDHGQHSVVSQKLYRNGHKDRKGNTED
jgi:hypothetical protein